MIEAVLLDDLECFKASSAEEVAMSPTISDAELVMDRIAKTPGVCGGAARISGTRIAVWMLLESRDAGCPDERFLNNYRFLTRDDLEAAWQYAVLHEDELRKQIKENRDS